MSSTADASEPPPLSDLPAFVAWTRDWRGPESVTVRQMAEDTARTLLDAKAGSMTEEEARALGRLFNTDARNGMQRFDRFSPAFQGATLDRIIVDLDLFNRRVAELWSSDEEAARATADQMFRDKDMLPGAGRSLVSMIWYLRDRGQYVPWMDATQKGLRALTGYAGSKRQGGFAAYEKFCNAAHQFAAEFDLAPQEIDGVLALGARFARQEAAVAGTHLVAGTGHVVSSGPVAPVLPADAFAFLTDLRAHNTQEFMDVQRVRYTSALRTPFAAVLEAVASRFLVDLDPQLNTEVKAGSVLASIRKRFPDEAGPYYSYFWGAFTRARKQEDVQLYVRIDWDGLRFGLALGASADAQLDRVRAAVRADPEAIWRAMEPVRSRLTFWLVDEPEREVIEVDGPADLMRWIDGPRPAAVQLVAPDDPLATSPELVDEIGTVLAALHPVAALAWDEPLAELVNRTETDDEVEVEAIEPYSLEQLVADTHLPIEDLEEWATMLAAPSKRQAIFYGPPGTGKTFVAEAIGRYLAEGGEVRTVQFHPSFSYEDFLEGLRPDDSSSTFRYRVRPGVFAEFCDRARRHSDRTFVFVIDEVNRADLSSVFGELLMLLEYRGKKLPLPYSQRSFSIPRNVVVLATMNTADRSLALVDFALRRRFHTIEMPPDRRVLAAHLAPQGEDGDLALAMFDLLQDAVADRDLAPGHSYWMVDDVSAVGLRRMWRYELRPYLAEHWFEQRGRLDALESKVGELLGDGA